MGSGGPSHGRAAPHQQGWHASKGNGKSSVPQPPVVRLSPDERVAEARARVVRLEAAHWPAHTICHFFVHLVKHFFWLK